MDVKFYQTTSANLPTLPVVNGQLIYLTDKDANYYDLGGVRHSASGVKFVSTLPSSGQQDNIIYVVIDANGKATASVWDTTSSTFKQLSADVATTASVGLVKPDGTTITITNDGTISCHSQVTSLPASSITYDNTTSGTTATNAQGALDEISGVANGAQSDVDYAMTLITAMSTAIQDLQSRMSDVEAVATRALITEDPVVEQNDSNESS